MSLTFTQDFQDLLSEVVPGDAEAYYDIASVDEALKRVDGRVQPAAHCAIFSKTERKFVQLPLKAYIMVRTKLHILLSQGFLGFWGT